MDEKKKKSKSARYSRFLIVLAKVFLLPILLFIFPKYHYEEGLEKKPRIKGRGMVVCNHNNFAIDGFMMYLIWIRRNIFPLVTRVFYDNKKSIWAWGLRRVGAIRIGPQVDELASPFENVSKYLELERVIMTMPEGGSNRSSERMLPFKSGIFLMALNSNAPIFPTYLGKVKAFKRAQIYVGKPIFPQEALDEATRTGEKPADALTRLTREKMEKFENEYFQIKEKTRKKQ